MIDAETWARRYDDLDGSLDRKIAVIRAIQSDASRSAARSERERCAKLMDKDAGMLQGPCNADLARQHAEMIRALPDDNALGADGAGEGEA